MKRSLNRTAALTAAVLTLSLSLAACGDDDSGDNNANDTNDTPSMSASDDMGSSTGSDDAMTGTEPFGEGCKLIPADGAGSFNGMATAPVATAASANPLLKTLVTAVTKAGLVDTLNSADALTVFAPTDDAFAKIDKKTLDGVLADKKTLTTILTHHVVAGKLSPDMLAGEHETLAGDTIKVSGANDKFTVAKEEANVLCGNIQTANATVYVIDTVLMP
ncbi:fasciclin domain-containing protein [Nocardioides sp. Bht2]|uniref:fasciclin domain-containing protein n=1 Tax=Nocardioides sp. Bht2 TaxID=3392297 RepID=UPI0039B4FCF0